MLQAYGYPVIKDTLDQAYSIVHSNAYAGSAYDKAEQLATSILSKLQPLQNRLPLATVDSYANAGLDYVEKKFPAVKEETNSLVGKVKKPADDAVGIAKAYADGVQHVSLTLSEQLDGIFEKMKKGMKMVDRRRERGSGWSEGVEGAIVDWAGGERGARDKLRHHRTRSPLITRRTRPCLRRPALHLPKSRACPDLRTVTDLVLCWVRPVSVCRR